MNVELPTLLFATGAAGLLVAGGALLRSAFSTEEPVIADDMPPDLEDEEPVEETFPEDEEHEAPRGPSKPSLRLVLPTDAQANAKATRASERGQKVADAERTITKLNAELTEANAAREGQRIEMVSLRQRMDRQARAAEDEIRRLTGELAEARRAHPPDSGQIRSVQDRSFLGSDEHGIEELKHQVAELTTERDAAAAKSDAFVQHVAELTKELEALASKRDRLERWSTELKAERDAALNKFDALERHTGELSSEKMATQTRLDALEARVAALVAERDTRQSKIDPLEGRVAELTAERDTAVAKTEALERLVEGVRARSRELAEELKELRARV